MKKSFFALALLVLLAASCQKQVTPNNAVNTGAIKQQQADKNRNAASTANIIDTNFQNGDQVLVNIRAAFKKAGSFVFDGQLSETGSVNPQTYQEAFLNSFSGKLIWPQTEEDINNIHDVVTGNVPRDDTLTIHSIIVNNKKFTETGTASGKSTQGWQADFINNPLTAKMGLPQQAYKFPDWLVLDYAQSLKFVKQDGGLYEYTIVPKTLAYVDAYADFNHQGRLADAGNPSEAGPSDTSDINGTVWIDSSYFVNKEQYYIQHWNEKDREYYHEPKEGVNISINYSDYNQKFSIKEPIATPQLDEIAQKVKAGESPDQIEHDLNGQPTLTPAQLDSDTQKQLSYFDSFTGKCDFTSTADWKTLTDSRNGYTTIFKYPNCWDIWTNPEPEMSDDYFLVRDDSTSNPEGETFSGDQPPLFAPWVEIGPAAIFSDSAITQEYEQNNFDTITKQTPVAISGYSGMITLLTYDPSACSKLVGQGVQNMAGGATNCQTLGGNTVALNIADQNSTSLSIIGIKIQSNNTDSFDYAGLMNKIISTMTVTQNGNKNLDSHQ